MVVSTGALMAHGMSEAVGETHYKYHPSMADVELFEKGYNRVYDTLEMELNLNHVEQIVGGTLQRLNPTQPISSEILNRELGLTLHEQFEGPAILKSAYLKGVPVYIPAFTDSELGLDVSIWAMHESVKQGLDLQNPTSNDSELWKRLQNISRLLIPFWI